MRLLDAGADPNARDYSVPTLSFWQKGLKKLHGDIVYNITPPTALQLELCFEYGPPPENIPLVKALIEHGANVNMHSGNYGNFPLLEAATNGYKDTVLLLLKHGADVNEEADGGLTALKIAKIEKHTEVVNILKAAGAKER